MEFLINNRWIINQVMVFVSFIGVMVASIILLKYLFKKLTRKELLFLFLGLTIAFLLRYLYGNFAPVHPEDHHVDIIMNLVKNLEEGSFFQVPYIYGNQNAISGGLFELIYHNILSIFPSFHVYQIYYISIFLHLLCGALIFLLSLNIFKKKKIAFIALAIFIFLPILIKFSATEIVFIVNGLSILLFINFAFYIFKENNKNNFNYSILTLLFIANLVGRKEYMLLFPISVIVLTGLFLIQKKNKLKIKLKSLLPFLILLILVMSFYVIAYLFTEGNATISEHYLQGRKWGNERYLLQNFFLFHDGEAVTFASFMKSFFTPWYFLILFLFTPLIIFLSKKWVLFFGFLIGFAFAIFAKDLEIANSIRKLLPCLFLLIPLSAYTFYTLLQALKIKKNIAAIAILIIVFSTFQNLHFLQLQTARKAEQDFLLYHLEKTIPPDSLILTIHEKKYEKSTFPQNDKEYKYQQHGLEFYSYLLIDKEVAVMDIYKEYNPEIIKKYENVFYYRSLYAYHEKNDFLVIEKQQQNPDNKNGPEVTEYFENNHTLMPVAEKKIWNYGFHNRTIQELIDGINYSIKAQGELQVGFYQLEEF